MAEFIVTGKAGAIVKPGPGTSGEPVAPSSAPRVAGQRVEGAEGGGGARGGVAPAEALRTHVEDAGGAGGGRRGRARRGGGDRLPAPVRGRMDPLQQRLCRRERADAREPPLGGQLGGQATVQHGLAVGGFVAGGVLLAGGAALALLDLMAPPPSSPVAVRLVASPASVGMTIRFP